MGDTRNTISAHIASKGFYSHYDTYNPEKVLDADILPRDVRANIAYAMAGCAGLTGATLSYCQKQQPKAAPKAAVHPPFTAGPSTPTKAGTKVTPSKSPTYKITSDPRKSGDGDDDKVDDDKNTEGRSKKDCEDACAALKESRDGKCKDGSAMGGWNGSFNADGKCACDCASNDTETATPTTTPAATTPAATTPAATTGIGGGLSGIYNSICASKIPFMCDSPANFKVVFVIIVVIAAFVVFRSVMRR